ncbi:unnamed protein product [Moneuplotes crassus]|uniref:Uncharacterized protein n=1 Tax=Euplotes crassus TaxID=5936 RepID=A0AAD1U2X0_EUPCR|nr:unnamed protein product [Moneuplotes crassus]
MNRNPNLQCFLFLMFSLAALALAISSIFLSFKAILVLILPSWYFIFLWNLSLLLNFNCLFNCMNSLLNISFTRSCSLSFSSLLSASFCLSNQILIFLAILSSVCLSILSFCSFYSSACL